MTVVTWAVPIGADVSAQRPSPEALRAKVQAFTAAHDVEIVGELSRFLAIPNLATDAANIRRNADHLMRMMSARGIAARLLESPTGGPPAVYGELPTPGATRTVVLYAHYAGVVPSVNLKFFFEGEEEAGSGHLEALLIQHKALLAADAWLFGDGPVHQSRRQQVVFGVRGVMGVNLTVYGPSRGLHSGHYGNWAPNPVALLANLIASMRDDDGHILITRFYDDVAPITPAERRALASIPSIDSSLRVELALGATEAKNAALVDRLMLPALNLRGIRGGGVNELSSNTIPPEATASIDLRMVPRQTPARVKQLVEAHVRARGYFIVDHTPTTEERMAHAKIAKMIWESGYPATRVSMDAPLSRAAIRAIQESVGGPIVALPTLGGSLPLHTFETVLHTPLIVLPIVNHDNNQHAQNENLRMQNLFDGIQVYAGMLARLGTYWKPVM